MNVLGAERVEYEEDGEVSEGQSFASPMRTLDTLYQMMLGEYERDNFPDIFTTLLSFLFMVLVVVVMMNVLIAIVSDSYDNAMVRSNELFWRARLELVAEVSTTFKQVLARMPTVERWEEFSDNRGERSGKPLEWYFDGNDDWRGKWWAVRISLFPIFLAYGVLYFAYYIFFVISLEMIIKRAKKRSGKKKREALS